MGFSGNRRAVLPLRAAVVLAALALPGSGHASTGGSGVSVTSSSPGSIELHLSADRFVLEADEAGRATLRIPGRGQVREPGQPILPRLSTLIAVPYGTRPRLEIVDSRWRALAMPELESSVYWPEGDEAQYAHVDPGQGKVWPLDAVRIAMAGRLRGHQVALVEWFPLRWAASSRLLHRVDELAIRIVFEPDPSAPDSGPALSLAGGDPFFEGVADNLVINPEHLSSRVPSNEIRAPLAPPAAPSASSGGSAGAFTPVKILVDADGIFAVSGADLISAGADLTGIDPRNLVLTNMGSAVDALIEGESDGIFDPTDTLVFHGVALDTRYTTTNVYWLSEGAGPATRMASADATPASAPPVTTYRHSVRREGRLIYGPKPFLDDPDEYFYWERLDDPATGTYLPSSDVYRVTTLNLPASAAQARLVFDVHGRSSDPANPDHHTQLYVNGNLLDDQLWDGVTTFTHDVSFDASILIEGENVIELRLIADPGITFTSLYSNWFQLEFDDSLVAEADRLEFTLPPGPALLEAHGFSGPEIEAFDISDAAHPLLLTGGAVVADGPAWKFSFERQPTAAAELIVQHIGARLAPSAIVVDTPSSWGSASNAADLIVITREDMSSAIQPLITLRIAEGLRVAEVFVQDIMDEFSNGVITPVAIRDFLAYAYANWQAPAPAFVLLVGDGTIDYRGDLGWGTSVVPTQVMSFASDGEIVTDTYFVQIDGPDPLADMYIGRIAVTDAIEAADAINKIVSYSQNPPLASTSDAVLLVADDEPVFESVADDLAGIVPLTLDPVKVYAIDFTTAADLKAQIKAELDLGALVSFYFGHGAGPCWGRVAGERFWCESDVPSLVNAVDQTFNVSLNCKNGHFAEKYDSLGEHWLRHVGGGGVAAWSSSGYGLISDYDVLSRQIFERIFALRDSLIGRSTFLSMARSYSEFGITNELLHKMILFADPTMHLAMDIDRDDLADRDEQAQGSDSDDADTDDDGVLDGQEPSWNTDSDGDGALNVLDPDSDDDGLPDGLERGVATPPPATDTVSGMFRADADPASVTDPLLSDSDGGGAPDGAEDRNANGQVDAGETDPNLAGDDGACAPSAPVEVTDLNLVKSGSDVTLAWSPIDSDDPCVLYRLYVAHVPFAPASFGDFEYLATATDTPWVHPGAALSTNLTSQMQFYLVTADSPVGGEGTLGHYGL